VIEWIKANPPQWLHSTYIEYYQRYYDARYVAGIIPLDIGQFSHAMKLAGYVLHYGFYKQSRWRNPALEAADCQAVLRVLERWIGGIL
jgi:hypothetical protein